MRALLAVMLCARVALAAGDATEAEQLMARGEQFAAAKQWDSAIAAFNAARALAPDRPGPYLQLGLAMAAAGRCGEAVPVLQTYISMRKQAARPEAAAAIGSCRSSSLCPPGQLVTEDTSGRCCWPGQVWDGAKCIGVPTRCPPEMRLDGQACVMPACASGMVRATDGVHCCWPGQAWSKLQSTCVGEAQCAAGSHARGGGCVADGSEPPGTHVCKPADLPDCRAQCDRGNAESCHNVAQTGQDPALLFGRACAWGHNPSCAPACERGKTEACARACKLGSRASCRLGWEEDCEAGDGAACLEMGTLYERGEGVKKDVAEAAKLYEKGCNGNHAQSCRKAGDLYAAGKGVGKDFSRAATFLRKACQLGEQAACPKPPPLPRAGTTFYP